MKLPLLLLLGTLVFQAGISPLVLPEDCAIVEASHSDDDCSPLCATCDCGPLSHAFQIEIVPDQSVRIDSNSRPSLAIAFPPDAPTREILHVPLALASL